MAKSIGIRWLMEALKWSVVLLIVKVTWSIVSNYIDYLPPNFESEFLLGRRAHFHGVYAVAFYAHIASSPVALLTSLVLLNRRIRTSYPQLHRWMGRMTVGVVLFVVAPSGLVMSTQAFSGWSAGTGFVALSVATAGSAAMAWRRARSRRFSEHRVWAMRCFLLLSSAIILRLIAGVSIVFDVHYSGLYPVSAWVSWLTPLFGYELYRKMQRYSYG